MLPFSVLARVPYKDQNTQHGTQMVPASTPKQLAHSPPLYPGKAIFPGTSPSAVAPMKSL